MSLSLSFLNCEMGNIIYIYRDMLTNKQDNISSMLKMVPVGRDAEYIVVMCIRLTEQCLSKIYVEFSNNEQQPSPK